MGIKIRKSAEYVNNLITAEDKINSNKIDGSLSPSQVTNDSLSNITQFSSLVLEFDKVRNLSSDPTSPNEGDIWYNTTDNDYKVAVYDNATTSVVTKILTLT